jgi:hypothetical protein
MGGGKQLEKTRRTRKAGIVKFESWKMALGGCRQPEA